MSSDAPRWLASLHGLIAWAGALLLASAAWSRLRARAGAVPGLAAPTAAAFAVALAAASGFVIEPAFLHGLRQRLFLRSAALGWLFERKQHLSAGALFLALAVAAALHAGRRSPVRLDPAAERLAVTLAAVIALAAAIAGTVVAVRLRG